MKVVLLAGGLGTRLSEETHSVPKPMVEIGGKPILWHIMKIYSQHGINDFIICLGYKGYVIKEFFLNYFHHMSDVTVDLTTGSVNVHRKNADPWKVTLVDTGLDSMTGGRLKRVADYLPDDKPFCMTYGDGVGDIDITSSIDFHKSHGKLATVTSVSPPGRFGLLKLDGSSVEGFEEKPQGDGGWINGGFFVLDKRVIDYIDGDHIMFERQPLEGLARDNQLKAYSHNGFWRPMDTLRDKNELNDLWHSGQSLWLGEDTLKQ